MTLEKLAKGQLWMSTQEMSLGIGRIGDIGSGSVNINFANAEISRQYNINNAPLERVMFCENDIIPLKNGELFRISSIKETEGLYYYKSCDREICETEISDNALIDTPAARIMSGEYDLNQDFYFRYYTHQAKNYVMKSPCRGMIGARINLFKHQLYISSEAGGRHSPRVILADEVGLGKTIEACLIVKNLIVRRKYQNVLVLAPEHLIIQWFSELYHRFGLTFGFIDDAYYEKKLKVIKNFNPVAKNDKCIISFNLFESKPEIQKQVADKKWDMIIIDEAHHILADSNIYKLIEKISDQRKGLILLTAVPDYPGPEHYFARLKLIDSARFFRFDKFFWEYENFNFIAEIAEKIIDGNKITGRHYEKLKEMLLCSSGLNHLMQDREILINADTKKQILEFLMNQHGIGRFLFRNTRKNTVGFPKRIIHIEGLDNAAAHGDNAGTLDITSIKVKRILKLLKKTKDDKILLICRSIRQVSLIEKGFMDNDFKDFETFHEDMEIIQRDKKAADFHNSRDIRLLISSEIGSEGRNFQFCRHLIFFDIPDQPDLIEQRIGRLDRIGQKNNISIYLFYIKDTAEEHLIKWLNEGLNAFNTSIQGCEKVFYHYHKYIINLIQSEHVRENLLKQLDGIISQTVKEKSEIIRQLDKGRDRLIELNSFHPEEAQKILNTIEEYDKDPYIEYYMNDFFEYAGISQELTGDRTYLISSKTPPNMLFPEIDMKDFQITYERALAIDREDMDFITIDHHYVERAFQFILGSQKGTAVAAHLKSNDEKKLYAEMIFIIEPFAPERLNIERFLPQTYVKIIIDQDMNDCEKTLDTEELMEDIKDMNDLLFQKIRHIIDKNLRAMVHEARNIAYSRTEKFMSCAENEVNKMFESEIIRLNNLKSVNNSVKEDEIKYLMNEKEETLSFLKKYQLRLDGLKIIWKG